MMEYISHNVSNFVIQTLLATTRNAAQTKQVLEIVAPAIKSGLVVDPSKKRRGILWRSVEASVKYSVYQDELLQSIIDGLSTYSETSNATKLDSCLSTLLCLKKPTAHGERVGLDVPGTRTVFHILRFESPLSQGILEAILRLPVEDLELLAKDGLGSKCVWDGILDGPLKDTSFSAAIKELRTKLSGRWVALATDRVGHHVVKKVFRSLSDIEEQQHLVEELSDGRSRLNGNSMGRDVMDACLVREFTSEGVDGWRSMTRKMLRKKEWLADLVHADEELNPKKGKNKRKKKHKDRDSGRKSKRSKPKSTVESILQVLSASGES
jgi:hypothetical protein